MAHRCSTPPVPGTSVRVTHILSRGASRHAVPRASVVAHADSTDTRTTQVQPPSLPRPPAAPGAKPLNGIAIPAMPQPPAPVGPNGLRPPAMGPPTLNSPNALRPSPSISPPAQPMRMVPPGPIATPPSSPSAGGPQPGLQTPLSRPGQLNPAGPSAMPPRGPARPAMSPPSTPGSGMAGMAAIPPPPARPGIANSPSGAGTPVPPAMRPGPPSSSGSTSPQPQLNRPPGFTMPILAPSPSGLGPPRPMQAGGPGLMPPPTPGMQGLNRPVARPTMPTLNAPTRMAPPAPGGPPSTMSSTISAPGALPELKRPEPPTLRVLESLMPRPGVKPKVALEEVAEDDLESFLDEEDDEFLAKKPGKKGAKKRTQKVTAEMRRKAAAQRKADREEKAAGSRKEREEIFEVGDEGMSLEELAETVQVEPSELVRSLFMKGIMLSMNQVLDKNTCKLIAAEYDVLVVDKAEEGVEEQAKKRTEFVTDEDVEDLVPRPPVVTVMGHVDHGKTSLLDYIRKSRVAAGEAGGITQGIGAYNTTVDVDGETKTICFLDTPGHEAFSAMRARGAKMTDVAIIIVAADDGVRPQTREAVSHAQAAGVPLVVAINKVDKPGADVERVKQELLELNLVAEEWGGTTPMVAVSAKKGQGMADLLQMVSWVAEEMQLMSNPKKPAQGTVIEAHLDKKKGPVASLLVQAGTLRVGDIVSAGCSYGKVRSMLNDLGQSIGEAGPSIALQLSGLDSVPDAGEEFQVYASEAEARDAAATFLNKQRMQRLSDMTSGGSMITLSSLASIDDETEVLQRMNLVIKADTIGVVQAIKAALGALPQESVTLRYLLSAAGDITTSDVDLAAASQALLVGFNLEPSDAVQTHAKRLGVTIMTYKVIYNIVDDIKAAMEGRLRAVEEKVVLGKAEVKAIFGSGKRKVAGCVVLSGKVQKGAMVCVMRGKRLMHEGKLSSLRRLKDNVEEVSEGTECGLGCDDFLDWAEGDVLEVYNLVSKSRRLEDAKAATAVDVSSLAM